MSGRPKSEAKARRIAKEHAVDPKCRACRRPTTLRAVGEDPGPLDAVLARWLARDDPRNLTFKSQKIRRLVCLECAHKRASVAEAARPIEELRWRSGMYGKISLDELPTSPLSTSPARRRSSY